MTTRLSALFRKELVDGVRNRAAPFLVAAVSFVALVLPFVVVSGIPALTHQLLSDDADLSRLSQLAGAPKSLSPEAGVQWFLFQQFLLLFLLTPTTGAMALAAHGIIGEKQ